MKQQVVVINGRAYDAVTGLPVADAPISQPVVSDNSPSSIKRGAATAKFHAKTTKKSTTLNRRLVKKPTAQLSNRRPVRSMEITTKRHAAVSRFAKQSTEAARTPALRVRADRPAEIHPVVHRAKQHSPKRSTKKDLAFSITEQRQKLTPSTVQLKSPQSLKHEAITEALLNSSAQKISRRPKRQTKSPTHWARTLSVGFAVMLLAGYLTYLSMPNISIRMAAIQSGIDAKYPGYQPDGYAMSGPIRFSNGEVSITYAYADNSASYTLLQQKSNWDSAAVKEYFSEKTTTPMITMIDGLTIYSNGREAAWVNGGILYQISGTADLSSDQVQKIATSL